MKCNDNRFSFYCSFKHFHLNIPSHLCFKKTNRRISYSCNMMIVDYDENLISIFRMFVLNLISFFFLPSFIHLLFLFISIDGYITPFHFDCRYKYVSISKELCVHKWFIMDQKKTRIPKIEFIKKQINIIFFFDLKSNTNSIDIWFDAVITFREQ